MKIEARMAWKEPFKVIGQKIRFTPSQEKAPSENDITHLWRRFNPRACEIRNFIGGSYGLCLFDEDMAPGKPFDYMAGAGVSSFDSVPEGMIAESFSGGLYCVIQRRGPIDEIGLAYDYYYKEWLPNSDYTYAPGVEFEYYDERYLGNDSSDSIMEHWFPIRRKQALPLNNQIASLFVHVTDLRRAVEWYSQLLGLPLMEERLNGGPVYWFDFPGTGLVLDSNRNNRQNPEWREDMKPMFMLSVTDIDQAYVYIREKAEVFSEPHRHGNMAYFCFRDIEGHAIMACWSADGGHEDNLPVTNSPISIRISGTFVDVKNMSKASSWYTDLLGLPLDEQMVTQSIYTVPVTRGSALLLDHNRHLKQEPFSIRCMFDTDNIQAAYDYAVGCEMTFHGQLEQHDEVSFLVLKDPDGNLIMVSQMK